jgi:hypothetical protein
VIAVRRTRLPGGFFYCAPQGIGRRTCAAAVVFVTLIISHP